MVGERRKCRASGSKYGIAVELLLGGRGPEGVTHQPTHSICLTETLARDRGRFSSIYIYSVALGVAVLLNLSFAGYISTVPLLSPRVPSTEVLQYFFPPLFDLHRTQASDETGYYSTHFLRHQFYTAGLVCLPGCSTGVCVASE